MDTREAFMAHKRGGEKRMEKLEATAISEVVREAKRLEAMGESTEGLLKRFKFDDKGAYEIQD